MYRECGFGKTKCEEFRRSTPINVCDMNIIIKKGFFCIPIRLNDYFRLCLDFILKKNLIGCLEFIVEEIE